MREWDRRDQDEVDKLDMAIQKQVLCVRAWTFCQGASLFLTFTLYITGIFSPRSLKGLYQVPARTLPKLPARRWRGIFCGTIYEYWMISSSRSLQRSRCRSSSSSICAPSRP
ncbi:hypothetical protein ARMGADRAFT_732407 [Armillaria gallica]|uniref:Uncharacterized protein n=1 Tax=Armillaria gallica TaxID=47427 RepID=A0A2H3D4Y1_ARMGA|nr:hypothetical protein ARMGADRAFT_732407 [Armillaria gallica]